MNTFLKKSLALLVTFVIVGGSIHVAHAGDPLSRMLGNDQDLLALVKLTAVNDTTLEAVPLFVFPNSKITEVSQFTILRDSDYLSETMTYARYPYNTLEPGRVFFASLNKDGAAYVGKWGMYEVTGETYADARLLAIDSGDLAVMQWFMNTGGAEMEVWFDGNKAFVSMDSAPLEIYPAVENLSQASGVVFAATEHPLTVAVKWFAAAAGAVLVVAFAARGFRRKGK